MNIALQQIGENARAAVPELQKLSTEDKNRILRACAKALTDNAGTLLSENEKDIAAGKASGMAEGLIDRLTLTRERIEGMAEGLNQVADLPDPVGEEMEFFNRPNGLRIKKVRVPIGVIGIIYESRPNVTADAFALCFKTGNATILKGGSDAIHSNLAITKVLRETLTREGAPADAVQLIADTDRAVTKEFMRMNSYVDVLIPRGSAGLIRATVENATIPTIETGTGNCHIFIDETADLNKAVPIVVNAKTQRIGVCNACESLVVHEKIAEKALPLISEALAPYHVELRGDEKACAILPECHAATEEDYGTEYLDYILSIKVVTDVDDAIAHINRYNTKHSDCILTEDMGNAEKFLNEIDAACVYVNASTRFTDGFEFGFGAEIGISTQKLHARGPMGLRDLTSYKYQITGDGQVR